VSRGDKFFRVLKGDLLLVRGEVTSERSSVEGGEIFIADRPNSRERKRLVRGKKRKNHLN